MALGYRPMRRKDVGRCVEIISANPILSRRYGRAISELQTTWLRLLGSDAFTGVVFEESLGGSSRLAGAGVSVFVSDVFVREMKSPPFFWIGPEIVHRISRGDSPVLSDREVREANTKDGLNLVGWHGAASIEDARRVDFLNLMFGSFIELHRGFLIKELLGQADSVEMLDAMSNNGGCFFDPELCEFGHFLPGSPEDIINRPHLMGSTREMEFAGTWLSGSSLFSRQPPQFGFRRSEQRLLVAALPGGTDEELSAELKISLSSVRKTWLSIYDRVAAHTPELFREDLSENGTPGRGKGKKHRLLSHLREHPEELRPLARRLLPRSAPLSAASERGKSKAPPTD